ncbi:MAG: C45 family autoproteolytic acyltransferase/hydrolase [Bacteroidales bacterium]|nr:C45 family autoproteolytic acyltransferase/hydrolase [Bacteroidales bacterium]
MRFLKILLRVFLVLLILIVGFLLYFNFFVLIKPPVPDNLEVLNNVRTVLGPDYFSCGRNWLKRSDSGLWEMYIEGEAFERGAIYGILAKDLIYNQEKAFVNEIRRLIPADFYLRFLKYFIAWFNRNLDEHISREYQLEIYGVSKAASEEFSFVGPPYLRMLNYHAAHDIGHTLQNMGMVGCTSFAAWDGKSEDSTLIIGRNFDFYVGDDFSKEKIVAFYNPDQGYKFMSVTWGGMIGVVSGMNEKGLCVTINAAPSGIPTSAKTPVSILTREILQYAQNIEEAIEISRAHETFVAESFLIGSAQDNKAVIIEKSGETLGVFESDVSNLSCVNHFQTEPFQTDPLNAESIEISDSPYRKKRVDELLASMTPLNYLKVATILRDREGPGNQNIGMGNPYAINQLIAHHSVIFEPSRLMVWVSTNPYQLGRYVAYDLNKIFNNRFVREDNSEIYETAFEIPADSFLLSQEYVNFERYKRFKQILINETNCEDCNQIDDKLIELFVSLNPLLPSIYELAGDYYTSFNQPKKANLYYQKAMELNKHYSK